MTRQWGVLCALLTVGLVLVAPRPARAQWQIETKDGQSNIKIGFLAQPQLEVLDTPDKADTSKNIFLRRFRILFGGKIGGDWTFFFETDSPNLGKGDTVGSAAKDSGFIYLQDAFVTYNHGDEFKVDAGMILTPLGHNHNQSAATLLPVDYGPYTFTEGAALQERVGRDYGFQLRGYPLKQHLEYRLGVFQGLRGLQSRNNLRVAGRAVFYPFAADTGFFYGGTFQGSKRVVGLGASFDAQKSYRQVGADVFVEEPFHGGEEGVTAQFNWMRFDGKTFLPTLPRQNTYLFEAALHLGKGKVSPFFQYSKRDLALVTLADQSAWQAGVAFWKAGHQQNLKFSAGRQHTNGLSDRTQVLAQLQIFFY